jgi:hypothetical protein
LISLVTVGESPERNDQKTEKKTDNDRTNPKKPKQNKPQIAQWTFLGRKFMDRKRQDSPSNNSSFCANVLSIGESAATANTSRA